MKTMINADARRIISRYSMHPDVLSRLFLRVLCVFAVMLLFPQTKTAKHLIQRAFGPVFAAQFSHQSPQALKH